MLSSNFLLRGITWNHSRGYTPMVATSQRFSERHPEVQIIWEKRSLQAFADEPIAELSKRYDLLVIDHPWAGFAADGGVLEPLDAWMPEGFLEDLAKNSVGQSFASYSFDQKQWALPIDAAAPVSVYRSDLLEKAGLPVPETWEDMIEFGKRGLLACPSIPLDVYGNFLNLCVSAGSAIFANQEEIVSQEVGLQALERLSELNALISARYLDINPIGALELMAKSDDFAYIPYVYGYSNYSREGYAKNLLSFGEVVSVESDLPGRTMLGGTGLAISAASQHKQLAGDYAAFVAAPETQRGIFCASGGQPGHRGTWEDELCNEMTNDFFKNTLAVLDRAFVRPRYSGYLDFQDQAGSPIHEYLKNDGSATDALESLNRLYRENADLICQTPEY